MSDVDGNAGAGVRASTALALRTPAALKRAPTYFPTGHAEGWKVFAVAFGAPIALGAFVTVAAAGVGLGMASVALGALASPFGALGANHWFQERGKSRLRRAEKLYLQDTERGLHALRALADSGALPEVRLEAAARVAIDALNRSDIVAAIEALSIKEQDRELFRRRRSWDAGLRAEVLRSILAWLSPGSFTESGVAASEDINDDDADAEGQALVAALRVLERASEVEDGPLAEVWNDVEGSVLAREIPPLYIITLAVAAERLHELLDEFHERLRADGTGTYHGLLRRLFPRMQILAEGGYRQMTAEEPARGTSVALVAPSDLQELAELSTSELMPVSRATAGFAFLTTYAMICAGSMALTLLSGGPAFLGIIFGIMGSIYAGTPIGAIWGSKRVQRLERARRVAPLARLVPTPPQPWLTECASGPPGMVSRTSGYRRLTELAPSQMVLYLAAMKAEQSLARGELDEAWEKIEWWFASFTGKLANTDPLYAVGSSLVRVAALSGRHTAARRLLAVMPEAPNKWDDATNRTLYGNAPRASALAAALLAALEGQWDAVGPHLDRASHEDPVFIPPRDQALIAEIVRRTRTAGAPAAWVSPHAPPSESAWIEQIWPEPIAATNS